MISSGKFNFSRFIQKLEHHGVCAPFGGTCKVESTEIICGEVFQDPGFGFGRKKRQVSTDTLNIKFNFSITIDFTECTEVNCQKKYDKLIQVSISSFTFLNKTHNWLYISTYMYTYIFARRRNNASMMNYMQQHNPMRVNLAVLFVFWMLKEIHCK